MKKLLLFMIVGVIGSGMVVAQIEVKSPNGGEVIILNSIYTITWDPGGAIAGNNNVKIQLLKGGTGQGAIVKNTPNDGSYDWKLDKLANGKAVPTGNNFKIRIISLIVESNRDRSNGNFTIRGYKISKKNYPRILPDLRPELSVTPFKPNTPIYITVTVHNSNWADIKSSGGKTLLQVFYIGTNDKSVWELKKEWKIYGYDIPAKSSIKIKQETLLFNQQKGNYYIAVGVDITDFLNESDEYNNTASLKYIVD